jgi:hypothetical protein
MPSDTLFHAPMPHELGNVASPLRLLKNSESSRLVLCYDLIMKR